MTELQRRVPGASFSVASAPYRDRQRLGAQLRKMVERGEIESCSPIQLVRIGPGQMEWQAQYIRIREPRAKTPWYAAAFASAMGAVVGVGALLYYSRWVLLAAAGGIAALTIIAVVIANLSGGEGGNHRCGRSSC